MATPKDSRFRITVWPGDPVPEPRVGHHAPVELHGDWLLYGLGLDSTRALPFDAYLHEVADADYEDRESLRSVTEQLGFFVHDFDNADRDMPPNCVGDRYNVQIARYCSLRGWAIPTDLAAERSAVYSETHRPPAHIAEVSLRLQVLQRMGRHVISYASGSSLKDVWPEAKNDLAAWSAFGSWMNAATKAFHARVYLDFGEAASPTSGLWVSAYEVACLQILNHLNIGAAYNECANSTCGRPFVRQRGRGEHYTRTEGVRYCSRPCANQQTQRDYRLRQKKNGGAT